MKKCLLLVIAVFTLTQMQAAVRYVKPDAGSAAWSHIADQSMVYTSLGSAQGAAVSGDQVWVAAGTYSITSITMKEGVDFFGGFAGTETNINQRATSDLDQNGLVEPWEFTNISIVSGDGTGRVVSTNSTGGHYVIGVTWDGFTITNGGGAGGGCAVYLAANTSLKNCIVAENHGSGSTESIQGPIQNKGLVESCLVENNSIISNYSSGNPAIYGGGVACTSGGIVKNSVVRNNEITDPFKPNSGQLKGGGIYLAWGKAINCVVYNNTSGNGAGVYVNSTAGGSQVIGCTISNNHALNIAGGLYAYEQGDIYNNVIWNNKAGDGTGTTNNINLYKRSAGTSIIKFDYNAFNAGLKGDANNTVASPILYTLDDANTGGTMPANFKTVTSFQGVAADAPQKAEILLANWDLSNGSACVNVGNNAYNTETFDIMGNDRVKNTTIDLGAYETTFFPTALGDGLKTANGLFFPNPAKNHLNVNAGVVAVSIYNINGGMVKESQDVANGMEIAELPAGLYLVKMVLNNGSVKTGKLVKK